MNKPVTVIYEDFKQDLADLINNSGLPYFIVETVLQNYLNEVSVLSRRQYQMDKSEYDMSLNVTRNTQE